MFEKTILVVEDELMIAEDILESLTEMGYQVVGTAASGPEALQKVKEFQPRLVLMDIMLKGHMDGIETAEAIHKIHDCALIYLTAYTDQKMLQRAKITSPFGYILKPFREKELHAMVEISLYRHDLEHQVRKQQQLIVDTLLQSSEAIIVTDSQGFIQFINPAAEFLISQESDEVLNKQAQDLFFFKDSNRSLDLELLSSKEHPQHIHVRQNQGDLLTVKLSASRINKAGSEMGGFIISLEQEQGDGARSSPSIKSDDELFAICASCKSVRAENGQFIAMEQFFRERYALRFTHGICPGCFESLYPDYFLESPPKP